MDNEVPHAARLVSNRLGLAPPCWLHIPMALLLKLSGAEAGAQWQSTCLACSRTRIPSLAQKKKKKQNQQPKEYQFQPELFYAGIQGCTSVSSRSIIQPQSLLPAVLG